MRHAVMIVLCALVAAAPVFGQTSTVTLQNQETSTFWFVVDPPELAEVTVGSRTFAARVGEYLASEGDLSAFSRIGPEEPATLSGLAAGTHLLVGFFDVEGEQQLPVRAFSVQVESGEGDRFYAVFSGPALLGVDRSSGRIAALGQGENAAAGGAQPAEAVVEPVLPEEEPAAVASAPVPVEEEPAAGAAAPVPTEEEPTIVEAEPGPVAEEPPVEAPVAAEAVLAAEAPGEAAVEPVLPEEEPAAVASAPVPVEEEPAAVAAAPLKAEEEPPAVEAASLVASFAADYDPVVFTRESPAGFTVLPISQSRFWGEAGTRLESLDGAIDGSGVRLVLQTGDGFSADVSYFLYLFGERTLGRENAVTLEILPLARGGRGACVLWQRGEGEAATGASRPLPRLIGSVSSWGRTCTVEIAIDELPPEAVKALGEAPSLDLCSCRYDGARSVFEEFFFTTVQLADFSSAGDSPVTR
jgi:hypothetical protein